MKHSEECGIAYVLRRSFCAGNSGKTVSPERAGAEAENKVVLSEEEWKQRLSPAEYHVLREKGTEPPRSGEFDEFDPPEGYFACRACGNPLYSAAAKFHSGCGWPSFDKCVQGSVKTKIDRSFGMNRVEIMCNRCDGHLGHIFEGERFTETNQRHCVNSLSIRYHKEQLPEKTMETILKSHL